MANSAKDDKGGKAQGKGKGGKQPPTANDKQGRLWQGDAAAQEPRCPVCSRRRRRRCLPRQKAAEGPPSGGIKSEPA